MDTELNRFFAETLLGPHATENGVSFLMSLMQSAREGNFCWIHPGAVPIPSHLIEEGDQQLFPTAPIVRQGDRIYLQKNWVLETHLLGQIQRLRRLTVPPFFNAARFDAELAKVQNLWPEQKEALHQASQHLFTLIYGGPGTGKTYIAGLLVRLLVASWDREKKKRLRIALTAPTGKAAIHLQETLLLQGPIDPEVQSEAFTLHRLLKLKGGETKSFTGQRIDADIVLVDESSMVDGPLLANLLEAIGDETFLIVLGDPSQLPPINAGSFFADCADAFGIPLHQCVRTEKTHLRKVAAAIRAGDETLLFENLSCEPMSAATLDRLYEAIQPLISSEPLDPAICLQHYQRCRLLNALRRGPFGSDALNRHLFERMEQRSQEGQWWAIPILITTNAAHHDLYNGSSGVLIGQKSKKISLTEALAYFPEMGKPPFRFGNTVRSIPPFEISFCLSIHKSQGSEFDEVVALFPPGSENFGRECLYTAATRAKKRFVAFGEPNILRSMLAANRRRISGLPNRLIEVVAKLHSGANSRSLRRFGFSQIA